MRRGSALCGVEGCCAGPDGFACGGSKAVQHQCEFCFAEHYRYGGEPERDAGGRLCEVAEASGNRAGHFVSVLGRSARDPRSGDSGLWEELSRADFSLPDLIFAMLAEVKRRQAEACPTGTYGRFGCSTSSTSTFLLFGAFARKKLTRVPFAPARV